MQTIQIDEQMRQAGERAGQKAYERFKKEGIAQWHKERAEQEDREAEKSAESTEE